MENCIFCNKEKIKDDLIYESKNFLIKVGLGILAPGQLMIIPKEHYLCFGELPNELEEEHGKLKNLFQELITKKFSTPFLFEYGIWGQSVNHAHEHLIPLRSKDYKIDSILEEMIIPGGIRFEEVDRKKLKEIYKCEGKYVSIEEKGRLYVCHVNDLQDTRDHVYLNIRPFFTKIKGVKGIKNWSEMSEEDKKLGEEKRDLTKMGLADVLNSE